VIDFSFRSIRLRSRSLSAIM